MIANKIKEDTLTQSEIKELFYYNLDTGKLSYKTTSGRRIKNKEAGYLTPQGYRRVKIKGCSYFTHRIVFLFILGRFPKYYVDHINHNRSDNSWKNLREVNDFSNNRNTSKRPNNTSGFNGVCWDKQYQKWVAIIHVNGRNKKLGRFKDKSDAIACRKQANKLYKYHENHGL